ncbi:MAG: hypothetical protein ACRCVT_00040 [Leadbetterella sp.]
MDKLKLVEILSENNISEHSYSIYDGLKPDCVVVEKWGSIWKIYYVDERGEQSILDYAISEDAAFKSLLIQFKINA